MRNQSRCILAVVLTVAVLTAVGYTNDSAADAKTKPVAPTGLIPFELGKPIPVSVKFETDIKGYNLFSLGKIEFQLNKESHLTAKITIYYTTGLDLPTITYNVHAAVFDSNGKLLGTANAPRKINTWATTGFVGCRGSDMSIDFGISLNYDKAKYFALAINQPEIKVAKQPDKASPKQPDKASPKRQ